MKLYENGIIREMTNAEAKEFELCTIDAERAYWNGIDYEEAVNARIRERYTASREFAILRQKDEKPLEYSEYYEYCEECKAFVKRKKEEH